MNQLRKEDIMRRWSWLGVVSILMVCSLIGCQSNDDPPISQELGLDISKGQIQNLYNDRGFPGDGVLYSIVSFEDDSLLDQILQNDSWEPLPFDEDVAMLAYGGQAVDESSGEAYDRGPYLVRDEGTQQGPEKDSLVPKIENGWYVLVDRQSYEEKRKNPDMFARGSMNISLGVYDTDTKVLHYFRYDS